MTMHLVIAPILVPFVAGTLILLLSTLPAGLHRALALLSSLVQIGFAIALLCAVSGGDILVYRLGDWPAPWGIALVADRLAAWMVLITTLLAVFALIHASDGLDQRGRHFHVLFQMQLFGLCGAFLTSDLFNLFVFFEILLIASYGLLVQGGGPDRVRAGMHYVVLNLMGSTVFLFAAGALYASLGSLNMADLAIRAANVSQENLGLARTGGLLLFVVFALKAGLLPLFLWLPAAYSNTLAPVAALFAIMTKVGAYAILRVGMLIFGNAAGPLSGLFDPWLMPLAIATLAIAMLGALAAGHLRRLTAWLVIASIGTLLTAFSLGVDGIAAGLYYLPHGTFAAALLFLLADALARRRHASRDSFAPDLDMPSHGQWGALYFIGAVAIAGLPPLSGFLGKFLIMRASSANPVVWTVILIGALAGLIALARGGSRLFFHNKLPQSVERAAAETSASMEIRSKEIIPIMGLISLIIILTVAAGPIVDFTHATASQLVEPGSYIAAVTGGQSAQGGTQ